jgi:hypothetical protein
MGTMIVLFVFALIAGILLALRFKVFVLIPATLLAAAVIVASSHQPKLTIALTVVGTVALLQIGYIVDNRSRASAKSVDGALGRFFLKVGRGLYFLEGGRRSKKSMITRAEKRHLVQ